MKNKTGILTALLLVGMALMIPCYLFTAGNTLFSPWELYNRNRIALFVMTDDAPKICQHHHCSVEGTVERTEVYVVPEKDFMSWYERAKFFPDEGVKLHGQRSIFDEKNVPKPG